MTHMDQSVDRLLRELRPALFDREASNTIEWTCNKAQRSIARCLVRQAFTIIGKDVGSYFPSEVTE